MKTIQGKDFEFSDVILYNHSDKEIVMIVNDPENLETFKYTGNPTDAPVIVVPYSEEEEKQIIANMKKIIKYEKVEDGIEIFYEDNTQVIFDLSNEEVVKSNLEAQNRLAKERIVTNISSISEEQKELRKNTLNEKLKKGIVAILADLTIFADDYISKNKKARKQEKSDNIFINRQYVDNSKKLYQEIINKNSCLLKYQQVINMAWDENSALQLIELINGSYSNSIKNMNLDNSVAEIKKLLQAIILIVMDNLNPNTNQENMINLHSYIDSLKDRTLIYNSMIVAKNAVNELVGDLTIMQTLDESMYSTVNKFTNEYKGAVNQLLNYEFKTINDSEFLSMNKNTRWIIISIFELVNKLIPEESSIDIEVAGVIKKMYYRYFADIIESKIYVPIINENGIAYYEGKTGNVYSKDDIFALAGLSLLENKIEPNPNIHEMGIYPGIAEKFEATSEELLSVD